MAVTAAESAGLQRLRLPHETGGTCIEILPLASSRAKRPPPAFGSKVLPPPGINRTSEFARSYEADIGRATTDAATRLHFSTCRVRNSPARWAHPAACAFCRSTK